MIVLGVGNLARLAANACACRALVVLWSALGLMASKQTGTVADQLQWQSIELSLVCVLAVAVDFGSSSKVSLG